MQTFIRQRIMFVVLLGLFCGGQVLGQVSSYRFTQDNNVRLISFDNASVNIAAGATADNQRVLTNIGFPFTFNGKTYSQCFVNVNGSISFGNTLPIDSIYPLGASFRNPRLGAEGAVSIFEEDLVGTSVSQVFAKTEGAVGSRQFTVQWRDLRMKIASFVVLSMEMTLNENGQITFEYASATVSGFPANSGGIAIRSGLSGSVSSDLILRTGYTWDNTFSYTNRNGFLPINRTSSPQRLRYLWTPPQAQSQPTVAPNLIFPVNNTTISTAPTFSWQPVAGATKYILHITNPQNTTNPLEWQFTNILFSCPWPPGTYTWAVQAIFPDGRKSSLSESRRLVIAGLPPKILSSSLTSAQQGQNLASITIQGQNTKFSANSSVRLIGPNNTQINGRVISAQPTSLSVSFQIPANAPPGSYTLQVDDASALTNALSVFVPSMMMQTPTGQVTGSSDFRPTRHGWGFGNELPQLWPESVWRSINYSSSTLPPQVRAVAPTINNLTTVDNSGNRQPQNFPSYEDYAASLRRIPSWSQPVEQLVQSWNNERDNWGGSCGGMTTTAMFAYVAETSNLGKYQMYRQTTPPASTRTLSDNRIRRLINQHQAKQIYYTTNPEIKSPNPTMTPARTVSIIRDRLTKPRDQQVRLFISSSAPNGGEHSVIPYRIVTKTEMGNTIDDVFVYDPNHPNDETKFIRVTTTPNGNSTWRYDNAGLYTGALNPANQFWTGGNGTFLPDAFTDIIPELLEFPKSFAATHSVEENAQIHNLVTFTTFNSSDGKELLEPDVTIRNNFGNQIGNSEKNLSDTDFDGVVALRNVGGLLSSPRSPVNSFIIPPQVGNALSIGYKPVGMTQTNGIVASGEGYMASPSWVASSTAQSQSMGVDFTNNVFTFKTPSAATAFGTTFAKVVQGTDAENVIRIQNSTLAANDSLDVQLLNDGDSFIINNYNSAKTYDLTLQRGAERTFARIQLGQNEQQRFFVQDWANIARSGVIALVDKGFDGVIDSTITFSEFTTTSVQEPNPLAIDRNALNVETFPNPSAGQFVVQYTLPAAANVQVELVNLLGQPVQMLFTGQQFSGKQSISADVQNIQSGTYFLRIRAGNASVVKPVHIIK